MKLATNGSAFTPGRRRFRAGMGTLSDINIIPLVDVVLVLLIIFMLTAHVMEFGLEVNVPQVKEVQDTTEDLPVVHIFAGGKIYLNDSNKLVNINALTGEIQRTFPDAKSVLVRADRTTIYDVVAQVVSKLGAAKLGVKLVTKPEEPGSR